MDNKKSTGSSSSKDKVAHRHANVRMIQNIRLIWLDNSIAENNVDCQHAITQLRRIVTAVNMFTDVDQCIDFLTSISNDKVCMVISSELCQDIVPVIHHISQLDTIFIFSEEKTRYEQLAKGWFKIKGVFTEITPICEALKQAAQRCEQNAISISFVDTSDDISNKKLDQLDSSFMYTQILKEILLTIEFEEKHTKEFIDYCHDVFVESEDELIDVKKLEEKYNNEKPIWWYTREYFLYSTLNRALRLMDVHIIIKMGCFVRDLHCQIEQLHNEQFGVHQSRKSITLYRGQGMSKTDFDQMSKTMGGLLSFNNFLSTSKDRDVSLLFAESNQSNPDLVGILFVITIDSSIPSTPFASINGVSYYQEEDEVLFSMHTVFRICDIKTIGENKRLFEVNLTLTSDNDKDLFVLTERMREETFPKSEGWYRLGQLLLKMGQFDKAEELYEVMLDQTTNENEKGPIYHQIGWAKQSQGEYKEAITFYQKSIEIEQKTLPLHHSNLADSYNNVGAAYGSMNEYSEALSFHARALDIRQQSLPPNHPDLAASYSNIGNVHYRMGEYPKAFSSYEKALEVCLKILSPNDPDLAALYNNIGSVCEDMGDYLKALSSHKKALEIRQKSLPSNHPDLASSYNNIGTAYGYMGEYPNALLSHEKALEIRQKSLPLNHPDLAASYGNIGNVYGDMGEYSNALLSHEKALEIFQKILPPNNRDIASCYDNIGAVYRTMGKYEKARSFHEKALEIRQQSLTSNHPDLAVSCDNTGNVYDDMGEYLRALSFHEKALEIRQKAHPPNYPNIATSYNNIGGVYYNMDEYPKALSFYEKALEIRHQSLPPNHPDLIVSYNNIGATYESMGNYSKSRSFYELAVDIGQRSLPSNHPYLEQPRKNLELVKRRCN